MSDETPRDDDDTAPRVPPTQIPPSQVPPTQAFSPQPPPPVVPPSGPPPGAAPPPGAVPPPGPMPPLPESSSGAPILLIVGLVALLAVLAVGLFVVVGNNNDDEPETDASAVIVTTPVDTTATTVAPTDAPTTIAEATSAGELARSVVQIVATFPDGTCTGSGTIIDSSGLILTNSHVVTRSEICPWDELLIATVDTPDLPPRVLFTGAVVADDPALDLAAVRIVERLDGGPVVADFPAIEIGESSSLELGDDLRILGFPGIGGETITFTEGTISGFITQPGLGTSSWVKTDASIAGGNSGGLAADAAGRMVGIPSRAGTGDVDDITDCRLVADTNGDGVIDEADSCIPIGGFINGIRPIDLAADIIAEGRAADVPPVTTPPTTTPPTTAPPTTAPPTTAPPTTAAPGTSNGTFAFNPRFSLQTANGLPDPEVFVVPDGSPQLCLTWSYEDFAPGAPFEFGWAIDGQADEGSFSSGTNQGGASGEFFGCIENPGGLVAGRYEAFWLVDGNPIFNHSIYVGGGRSPVTIGLQNDTGTPICFVSWTPVGAATRGLLRNTAAINPGERFETVLATGRYQTVVGDCDGNIIFRDPDTEFTSDLTLTLPV